MEVFNKAGRCPKCGNKAAGLKVAHHPAGETSCTFEHADEHMHRSCNECGYEWPEMPLS